MREAYPATFRLIGASKRVAMVARALGVTVLRPPTKAILDKLNSVPVDIEPRFVTAIDLLK